jgi:hypothetical protein
MLNFSTLLVEIASFPVKRVAIASRFCCRG